MCADACQSFGSIVESTWALYWGLGGWLSEGADATLAGQGWVCLTGGGDFLDGNLIGGGHNWRAVISQPTKEHGVSINIDCHSFQAFAGKQPAGKGTALAAAAPPPHPAPWRRCRNPLPLQESQPDRTRNRPTHRQGGVGPAGCSTLTQAAPPGAAARPPPPPPVWVLRGMPPGLRPPIPVPELDWAGLPARPLCLVVLQEYRRVWGNAALWPRDGGRRRSAGRHGVCFGVQGSAHRQALSGCTLAAVCSGNTRHTHHNTPRLRLAQCSGPKGRGREAEDARRNAERRAAGAVQGPLPPGLPAARRAPTPPLPGTCAPKPTDNGAVQRPGAGGRRRGRG